MSEPRWPDPDPRPTSGGRAVAARARRRRRWGALPGRTGVFIVIGSAALGAAATVAAGSEPGLALGVFLVAGTAAAALAVRPRAVYRIIPVPALGYVAAAIAAGLVHDRAADTSRAVLAVSAVQWISGGFVAMTAATVLAIVMTAARLFASRRDPADRFDRSPAVSPGSPSRPGADQGLSALRGMRQVDECAPVAPRRRRSIGRNT